MLTDQRRHRKLIAEINVVPYIDVMLVLLIIFMVTAPLVTPGAIELPSVGSKLTVPVQPLEITLRKDGRVILIDKALNAPPVVLSLDQMVDRVRAAQEQRDQPVVIAADKGAIYEDVLKVLDRLQQNGIRKVGLLARPPAT